MVSERLRHDSSPLKHKTLRAPFSAQVELTERCNNRCAHCYNFYRHSQHFSTLSPERTSSVVKDLGEAGVFSVTFTGGEPLLAVESLLAGLKECDRWDMGASLNSNLTIGTIDEFKELKRSGLSGVLTSLASSRESVHDSLVGRRGAFNDTIEGIKRAKLAGLRVVVNMVVGKGNLSGVYRTGLFCYKELGIDTFSATRVGPSRYNLEWFNKYRLDQAGIRLMLDQLLLLSQEEKIEVDGLEPLPFCGLGDLERYQIFTKRSCSAGITLCTIGAGGEVRPCPHADVAYGNIFSEGFQTAWQQMQEWRDGSLIPEECWDCGYLVKCRAGCRMMSKYAQGIEGELNQQSPYASKDGVLVDLPPSQVRNPPDGFLDMSLAISSRVKFREEEFGGVAGVGRRNLALVNDSSFSLLRRLDQKKGFTLREVRDKFNFDTQELLAFFGQLFINNIVVKAKAGYETNN